MDLNEKSNPRHNNTEGPKFKKLTIRDQIRVVELLKLHCKVVGDYAVYAVGYSDDEIYSIIKDSPTASLVGVSRIRRELYGNLRPYTNSPHNNVERLERLERIVAGLCKEFGIDPLKFEIGSQKDA